MKMSFIGAGKVGTALGIYFKKKGFNIEGYYSRSNISSQKASKLTDSQAFDYIEQLATSDIIWITTNDDVIEEVGKQLAELETITDRHIIAHMSGAHGSSALNTLREKGCSVYSIHPLQAFASPELAVEALEKTVFTIEGSPEQLPIIKSIFDKTGNMNFIINEEGKTLYHAGACILSNYLVTLIDVAFNLFQQAGIERDKILDATMPLIMGTLNNIKIKDTKASLTGPIQRSDYYTIQKHIAEISSKLPEEIEFYQFMGLKTLQMIEDNKSVEQIEILKKVLNGGSLNE